MKSVCILHGFCEGPRVSRKFRAQLVASGFRLTKDASKADVLIGHSGGCFLIPEETRATQIIQIGIPYWPGHSMASSIWRKIVADLASHRGGGLLLWIRKTFWNMVYFWNMPANVRMLLARKAGTMWKYGSITVVARPELDTICTSEMDILPFSHKATHITIQGHHHDDCWRYPQKYIDLIV